MKYNKIKISEIILNRKEYNTVKYTHTQCICNMYTAWNIKYLNYHLLHSNYIQDIDCRLLLVQFSGQKLQIFNNNGFITDDLA
jgi:hypothetical protein